MTGAQRSKSREAPAARRGAAGYTLIEVLVALVVLSVGLLGVAGLQIVGLKGNLSAASRTQASYLAEDIIDRMRANYVAARGDSGTGAAFLQYQLTMGATAPSGADATAVADVTAWVAELQTLPSGQGSISVDGKTNIATVTIQWLDTRGGDPTLCSGANLATCTPMSFQTQTQL
jgi:type IV pilus assembly protein PilV